MDIPSCGRSRSGRDSFALGSLSPAAPPSPAPPWPRFPFRFPRSASYTSQNCAPQLQRSIGPTAVTSTALRHACGTTSRGRPGRIGCILEERSIPCSVMRSSCSSIHTSWNDSHMTPANRRDSPAATASVAARSRSRYLPSRVTTVAMVVRTGSMDLVTASSRWSKSAPYCFSVWSFGSPLGFSCHLVQSLLDLDVEPQEEFVLTAQPGSDIVVESSRQSFEAIVTFLVEGVHVLILIWRTYPALTAALRKSRGITPRLASSPSGVANPRSRMV